ncbi:hypothetical protein LguiB_027413 [Lonicera macranthoides]
MLFVAFTCLLFSSSSGGAGAVKLIRCRENERQALLNFKKEIVDNDGLLLSSWGSQEEDCCKWRGIRCSNTTDHVILLDVHGWYDSATGDDIYLSGKVSPSLLELNHLKYLDVSGIDFQWSPIPEFIGSLSKLQHLSLSYSFFSGRVPHQLGNLTNLKYLDLSGNIFYSSPIPEFIGSLSKLQHLNLSDNFFVGRVPHQLGNLTNLKYLDLSGNNFQSIPIPEFIGSLSKLQHLYLSQSNFVGRVPHQLGNLTNLRSLDLGLNSNLTVKNLEWLFDLRLLRHLDLSSIDLQKVDLLQSIDRLSFLSSLHLSYCNLPGIISPSLHLTNFSSIPLSIIHLSSNSFTNSSIYNWLFNFSSSLVDVRMSYNPLGGSIPDAFGNMMSLETLSLSYCALEGEIPKSFMNLSRIRSLDLSYNNLTGQLPELFQRLFASKNSLESLELSWNKFSGSLPDFTSFSSLRQLLVGNNKLNGSFPNRFGQSSTLVYLDLSENELNGSLPDLTSFPLLRDLYLANNKIQGRLPESIGGLSNLEMLDLSFNLLTLEFSSDWTPRFQLDIIDLSNCTLGPHFPEWLQSQSNLRFLHMFRVGIFDIVPHWFWDLSPRLLYLNISDNHIHGVLPDLSLKFVELHQIDLSSNRFEGPIPLFPRNLSSLNLSKNMFSGSIISLCTIVTEFLSFLDLSDNLLSGEVPDCWINANNLQILDLSNNNLSQKIPTSFGFLDQLVLLNLRNNSFIGELPLSLKNCSALKVIDMSENKLLGKLPAWIGTDLKLLVVLSFRKNEFHGSIPLSMCLQNHIQVLDLSQNKISGNIPQCFNKFYSLIQTQNSSTTMSIELSNGEYISFSSQGYYYFGGYVPSALVQWKGKVSEYKGLLGLLKCIDLSSNKLVGQIPQELASLEGLISLNLSRNNLTGPIIQKIGQIKMLEILDLSRNQLSGAIPIGLGNLNYLSVLDLSSNNFSSRIPRSTQLDTFNASVYAGNDKLCGLPLPLCPKDESTSFPPPNDNGKVEDTFVTTGFYVSVVLGFAIGFWGFIGPLVLRSSWRYAYFKILDNIQDRIYATIVVNMARVQRKFRR